ncbi:ribonuclease H-like domain-containing protein, partial [Vibrio sp. 10N.286.51.A4]
ENYKEKLNKIISSSFNLLSIFRNKIIFPCYTNSLKDIARHLNYEWTSKVKNGKDSISSRVLWELNNSNRLKSDLVLYNNNDCHALMVVYFYIKSIINNINSGNRKFDEEY